MNDFRLHNYGSFYDIVLTLTFFALLSVYNFVILLSLKYFFKDQHGHPFVCEHALFVHT